MTHFDLCYDQFITGSRYNSNMSYIDFPPLITLHIKVNKTGEADSETRLV